MSYKSILIFLIVALLNATISYGQVIIKGSIIDDKTDEPLPYANVILREYDTDSLIKGTVSDMEGKFQLNADEGVYYVEIQVLGYETVKSKEIKIGSETIQLKAFRLVESSFEIKEAVISVEKSHLVNKPGKQILNVGKDISGSGGNITNILAIMPSVEVGTRDEVSIRGNENVRVLINGKEVSYGISVDKILKQIPASSVEKIEVTTNTSAKDDPESSGGIINIILKKDKKPGIHGGASVDYGINPKQLSLGSSIMINKNRFSSNITYGYYNMAYKMFYKSNRYYKNNNPVFRELNYDGNGNYFLSGNLLTTSLDYNFNGNHNINSEIILTKFSEKWDFNQEANYIFPDATSSKSEILNNNIDKIKLVDISLSSDNKFSDNRKLKTIAKYSLGKFGGQRDATCSNDTKSSTIKNNGKYGMGEFKSDYEWDISKKSSLETGVLSNMLHFNFNVTGEENLEYVFNQQKHALYSIFTQKISKVSVGLGARLEYYVSKTKEKTNNTRINQNYLKLFPNIQLQYNLQTATYQSINLSYSKKIRRPNYEELNPMIDYTDPIQITQGNPELKPEFINSLELSHYINKDGNKLVTTLFGNVNTGVIQQKTELIDEYRLKTTYINFSKSRNIGIESNITLKPNRKIEINPSVSYIYKWFGKNADGTAPPNTKGNQWSAKANSIFKITRKISLPIQFQYYGTDVNSYVIRKPYYQFNAGLKIATLKGLAEFRIVFNDVFNTGGKETYKFENTEYESDALWKVEGRNIKFSLTIQF